MTRSCGGGKVAGALKDGPRPRPRTRCQGPVFRPARRCPCPSTLLPSALRPRLEEGVTGKLRKLPFSASHECGRAREPCSPPGTLASGRVQQEAGPTFPGSGRGLRSQFQRPSVPVSWPIPIQTHPPSPAGSTGAGTGPGLRATRDPGENGASCGEAGGGACSATDRVSASSPTRAP